VILVNASLLARSEAMDDARRIKAATRALTNVGRLNRMLGDLLDLAFAQMGIPFSAKRAEVDLGVLVDKTVEEMRAAYPGRSIAVHRLTDLLGQWDRDRLLRALETMVTIALKLGLPSETLQLSCTSSSPEGPVEIKVEVAANPGLGDHPQRLFDAVKPGAGIESLEKDGQWIALWALRHTIEGHGGTLQLSASASEGVRFFVRLPKREPQT
jgi:K+-sensing histidine kinase KdpD